MMTLVATAISAIAAIRCAGCAVCAVREKNYGGALAALLLAAASFWCTLLQGVLTN